MESSHDPAAGAEPSRLIHEPTLERHLAPAIAGELAIQLVEIAQSPCGFVRRVAEFLLAHFNQHIVHFLAEVGAGPPERIGQLPGDFDRFG